MISDRPYREAMERDEAIAELRRSAGSQFDSAVIEALVALLEPRPQPRLSPLSRPSEPVHG